MDTTQTAPRVGTIPAPSFMQWWGLFLIAFAVTGWTRLDATTSVIGWMVGQWGLGFVQAYLLTMFGVGVILLARNVSLRWFAILSLWFGVYIAISVPVVIADPGIPLEPLVVYIGVWVLSVYWIWHDRGYPDTLPRNMILRWLPLHRVMALVIIAFGASLLIRPVGALTAVTDNLMSIGLPAEVMDIGIIAMGVVMLLFAHRLPIYWRSYGYMMLALPVIYVTVYISVWLIDTPNVPLNPIPPHLMLVGILFYLSIRLGDPRDGTA